MTITTMPGGTPGRGCWGSAPAWPWADGCITIATGDTAASITTVTATGETASLGTSNDSRAAAPITSTTATAGVTTSITATSTPATSRINSASTTGNV